MHLPLRVGAMTTMLPGRVDIQRGSSISRICVEAVYLRCFQFSPVIGLLPKTTIIVIENFELKCDYTNLLDNMVATGKNMTMKTKHPVRSTSEKNMTMKTKHQMPLVTLSLNFDAGLKGLANQMSPYIIVRANSKLTHRVET